MATLTSPTLQQLIAEARTLLNQKNPDNSTWSDPDLTNWLNEGIRRFMQETSHWAEGHFTGETNLTITSGADTVALPADFFEIKMLRKKVNDGFIALPYRNNLTEGHTTSGGTSGEQYSPYYYFRNNDIVLRPTPNFTEVDGLQIEYIKFPTVLVNGGDSLENSISPIFRDLIIMFTVYKAKLQESLVAGTATHANAKQELNELYAQFKEVVAMRSHNPTAVIPFNPETEGM